MKTKSILTLIGNLMLCSSEDHKPLVKSFMIRILLSLSAINIIAIFLVKFDPNMPDGILENLRIVAMIMHSVLGALPLYVLFKISRALKTQISS